MVPQTATWIDVMIKAMTQVVIPAVDAEDAPATEQAQLVVNLLRMFRLQHPYILHYQLLQAREAQALTAQLANRLRQFGAEGDLLGRVDRVLSTHEALEATTLPSLQALEDAAVELKSAANQLIDRLLELSPETAAEVSSLVLAFSEDTVMRERTWVQTETGDPAIASLYAIFDNRAE